jgi:acyl-CoA synthetase (AMP-forming)/AMP-acid ligase II
MSTNKSEISGGPPPSLPDSLFAFFEPGVRRNPDKLAVVSKTQRGDHLAEAVRESTGSLPQGCDETTSLRWTYTETFAVSLSLGENLAQKIAGSSSGLDPVMVTLIPNSVEYLLLLTASTIAKTGIASLDVGMLQKARHEELERYIKQLQPTCIVVADAEGAATIDSILQGLQLSVAVKISLDDKTSQAAESESTWNSFTSLCKAYSAEVIAKRTEAARHDDPSRTAVIVYTSGTSSGKPKGCLKHVKSFITCLHASEISRPSSKTEKVRIIQTANFRVIAPLIIMRSWYDGATVVLTKHPFDVEAYLDDVAQERATDLALIPAMLHAIAASPGLQSRDLTCVEAIATGGDIVNSPLVKLAERTFPSGSFMTGHGMSECSGVFQWPYWEGSDSIPYHQGVSPVGRPSAGAKVRLVSEEGDVVPIGEVGELHVQHASVFKGYLERERKDMPEFYTDESGDWLKTGDLGVFSENGDAYIVGRKKDVVKRAGVSIAPAAIESCLSAYAGTQVSLS